MRHTLESPRDGKFITELSDVRRTVPDPALFKPPEGYELREDMAPVPSVVDKILREQKPAMPVLAPQPDKRF